MRIAFILPSLARRGPILVVSDIISQIHDKCEFVDVYYFDNVTEIALPCSAYRIDFSTKIDFDRYDIIHSHMFRPDAYVWKHHRLIKGKIITTMHCDIRVDLRYYYNFIISFIFRWVWLFFVRKFDKVVVLTSHIMNGYYKKYIQEDKLLYIYNGRPLHIAGEIDKNDKKLINDLKKKNYKIIGANAILIKRKRLHLVITALSTLFDYVFLILGEGKEQKNLLKLAIKLGVFDRCHFLGFKNNPESYLPFYDVYAMPSVGEGFGLALIEAALMKRSCVCSDTPEFHELFSENEVSFFSPKDKQSLCNAIKNAYVKRLEKGENAYRRAIGCYSDKIMSGNYYNLYETVLSKKN
jgi:glycosyltransferase involved in cell wall biosynthesis